jgi:hypothetical protein
MLFNSYEFVLVFLPAALVLFFGIANRSHRLARYFLLLASFGFYAWWSLEYGLLLAATVVVNHTLGVRIQRLAEGGERFAKSMMVAAVALNLGPLGYLKYHDGCPRLCSGRR